MTPFLYNYLPGHQWGSTLILLLLEHIDVDALYKLSTRLETLLTAFTVTKQMEFQYEHLYCVLYVHIHIIYQG